MARKRTVEDRLQAIDSLFRVRAVETPADTSGEKEVWHQGSKGADLFTVVNRTGHVVRQEFVLYEDYFLWTKSAGLRTGSTSEARGIKAVVKASDEISMDPFVSEDRVERARAALDGYRGNDKYLLHLRALINVAAMGGDPGELSAVTSAIPNHPDLKKVRDELQRPAGGKLWQFVAAGAGAGLLLVVLVWMMIR